MFNMTNAQSVLRAEQQAWQGRADICAQKAHSPEHVPAANYAGQEEVRKP